MSFAAILFASGMLAAAVSDLWKRRVPNWLNLSILIIGLCARTVADPEGRLAGLTHGLLGAGAAMLLLLPLFHRRWIAGGDVKLMIAAGAWLTPTLSFWMILIGLAGGGLISLAIAATGGASLRGEVAVNLQNAYWSRGMPDVPRRGNGQMVPMAVALASAALGVFAARGGF
jgi:Flp pilus assembly protein protease CpaA